MNTIKTSFILIAATTTFSCSWQTKTDHNMTNNSVKVPLNAGWDNNSSIRYETLSIEPVNLYIQSKPWGDSDSSPNVQLELNIVENDKKHNTFLLTVILTLKMKQKPGNTISTALA